MPKNLDKYSDGLVDSISIGLSDMFSNLDMFRDINDLKTVDCPFEICIAMSDKFGRICRQIKHMERSDPKPNCEEELLQELCGFIIYSNMLLNHYKIKPKLLLAMKSELTKAVNQHNMEDKDVQEKNKRG